MITESQIKPTKREVPSSQAMEKAFAADLAAEEKAREGLTEKEKTSLMAIKKYFFDKDSMYFSRNPEEVIFTKEELKKLKNTKQEIDNDNKKDGSEDENKKEVEPITFQQIKDRHAGALAIQEAGNSGKNKDKIMELMGITSEKDWQKLQEIASYIRARIGLIEEKIKENKDKEKLENARKIVEEAFEADKDLPKDIAVNEEEK